MKFWIVMIAAVLIIASVSLPVAIGQQSTYEKALVLEETELKLKDAIALYQKVVDGSKDKALAAQAQLHIGLCYEKLGAAEAEQAFRKVIEKYADQAAAVQVARERLSALTGPRSAASPKPGGLVLRQVSVPEGQPSPDGKFIAYVDYNNAEDLVIYEVATGKKKPLTDLGTGKSQSSYSAVNDPVAWSSDGSEIAFTEDDYDSANKTDLSKLCIIGRDGSNLKVIPVNSELSVWGIVGWSADRKALFAIMRNKDKIRSLQRVSLLDGNLREIKTTIKIGNISLSPDAKYIAYDSNISPTGPSSNIDIRLIASDGSHDVPIVEHPSNDRLMGWSADSSHIIFSSDRNGRRAIWAQAIKDGKKDGEPKYIKSVAAGVQGLGVTRSGSFYFVELELGGNDVYVAQLDLISGKTIRAPENVEPTYERHSTTPFWSPNGEYLGYLVNSSTGASTAMANILRLYSTNNGTKRDIALNFSAPSLQQPPRWSADGKYIYLMGRSITPPESSLYQVEVSTGQSKLLYKGDVRAWSGDGTIIYFAKTENTMDLTQRLESIFRKDLGTGEEKLILQGARGQIIMGLTLSPDGKWLGGSHTEAIKNNWVLPSLGGTPQPLLSISFGSYFFWGPSGVGALFERKSQNEGLMGLSYQPILEGKELINLDLEMPRINGLTFHPDGKTVAFNTVARPEAKVWVMENFLPAKK